MTILKDILLVGAGSFFGGIARYLVSLAMKGMGSAFPWATMTANIVGCLLIGLLWAAFNRVNASSQLNFHHIFHLLKGEPVPVAGWQLFLIHSVRSGQCSAWHSRCRSGLCIGKVNNQDHERRVSDMQGSAGVSRER